MSSPRVLVCGRVTFTQGDQGCQIIANGKVRRVGVFHTREVEPTGAGDFFAAGFLLGLARGAPAVEAARLGAAAASVVVEARAGERWGASARPAPGAAACPSPPGP